MRTKFSHKLSLLSLSILFLGLSSHLIGQIDWTQKSPEEIKELVTKWEQMPVKTDTVLNNLGYCYSNGIVVTQD